MCNSVSNIRETDNPSDSIGLSFSMESSASLWNIIFEGFDQEVVLISRFVGRDNSAVAALYKFAVILDKRYKDCKVSATASGIDIKKSLPENDLSVIGEWTCLMENIREEMIKCLRIA